jgi:hypothetical protein
MGSADIILDLVSTGVTLRENNLRTIEGGRIMDSQGVLVANRRALLGRPVSAGGREGGMAGARRGRGRGRGGGLLGWRAGLCACWGSLGGCVRAADPTA